MKTTRYQVLKQIRNYIISSKWSIVILIITSAAAIPVSLVSPVFFQILIDDVMRKQQTGRFYIVILGLLLVYCCRLILDMINLYCGNRLLNRFTFSLRKDVWNKYLGTPFSFWEKKEPGDLKMRLVDDVDSLGNFVREQVVDYCFHILIFFFCLILTLHINIKMTLYCLLIIPIVFIINHIIGNGTKKVNEDIRKVNEEYYTSTHNSLQFWKEIKAQGAENEFVGRFKNFRTILAKLGLRSIRYWAYSEIFNDFKANYLTKVFVYIIGSFFVLQNQISVGVLIMFAEYFGMLFTSLDTVNSRNVALKTNTPYYMRIFDTLSFEEDHDEQKKQVDISGELQVKNLDFGYKNEQIILKNINLHIKSGEYVAVIGHSGCGKTTLAKLILSLYTGQCGTISFDNNNVQDISKVSLYNQVGAVMQDSFLFNMSIRDNLSLVKENTSEEEIICACQKANIYKFIKELPMGLDTVIGERGIKLSGGQKQRLAIAQVLLKNPKIIIFDEATSSLDSLSENIINESINEISKNTTVLVISHKPATILRAKKTVVMDCGAIVDIGEHSELIVRNEFYRKLAEAG